LLPGIVFSAKAIRKRKRYGNAIVGFRSVLFLRHCRAKRDAAGKEVSDFQGLFLYGTQDDVLKINYGTLVGSGLFQP